MDSILQSIRKSLGVQADYDGFDSEIIMGINSSIMRLGQLGIGPPLGVTVTGIEETWAQLYNGVSNIESAKSYILLKTKLVFDPPTTAHLIKAITDQISELEFSLMVQVEPPYHIPGEPHNLVMGNLVTGPVSFTL